VGDLGALATSYGVTGGVLWSNGDFNHDSKVDVGDLGALATNYGSSLAANSGGSSASAASPASMVASDLAVVASGGSAAVPEPASLTLIGLGAMSLLARRRRRRV